MCRESSPESPDSLEDIKHFPFLCVQQNEEIHRLIVNHGLFRNLAEPNLRR